MGDALIGERGGDWRTGVSRRPTLLNIPSMLEGEEEEVANALRTDRHMLVQ
jgi:hypothetical protein